MWLVWIFSFQAVWTDRFPDRLYSSETWPLKGADVFTSWCPFYSFGMKLKKFTLIFHRKNWALLRSMHFRSWPPKRFVFSALFCPSFSATTLHTSSKLRCCRCRLLAWSRWHHSQHCRLLCDILGRLDHVSIQKDTAPPSITHTENVTRPPGGWKSCNAWARRLCKANNCTVNSKIFNNFEKELWTFSTFVWIKTFPCPSRVFSWFCWTSHKWHQANWVLPQLCRNFHRHIPPKRFGRASSSGQLGILKVVQQFLVYKRHLEVQHSSWHNPGPRCGLKVHFNAIHVVIVRCHVLRGFLLTMFVLCSGCCCRRDRVRRRRAPWCCPSFSLGLLSVVWDPSVASIAVCSLNLSGLLPAVWRSWFWLERSSIGKQAPRCGFFLFWRDGGILQFSQFFSVGWVFSFKWCLMERSRSDRKVQQKVSSSPLAIPCHLCWITQKSEALNTAQIELQNALDNITEAAAQGSKMKARNDRKVMIFRLDDYLFHFERYIYIYIQVNFYPTIANYDHWRNVDAPW